MRHRKLLATIALLGAVIGGILLGGAPAAQSAQTGGSPIDTVLADGGDSPRKGTVSRANRGW